MARLSSTAEIRRPPREVFPYLDDLNNVGMHMTSSSMAMMGGKLKIQTLSKNKMGKGPEFEKHVNDISRLVESSEDGTMSYQFYISDDRKKCIAVERYASSEAALAHLNGAGATTILPKILGVSAIT